MPSVPTPNCITIRTILNELLLMANLEKGIGYTVKALALFPGRAIREYLFEDKRQMAKSFPKLSAHRHTKKGGARGRRLHEKKCIIKK